MKALLIMALVIVPTLGLAEGNQAPPLLASPAILDPSRELSKPSVQRPAECATNPCAAGCSQQVTCEDYNPERDNCPEANKIVVGWECQEPCSCSQEGTVSCSVTYQCVSVNAPENADQLRALGPISRPDVELSTRDEPTAP